MTPKRIRRILGILVLLISLCLLLWGFLPSDISVQTLPVVPTQMQLPAPTPAPAAFAGIFLWLSTPFGEWYG